MNLKEVILTNNDCYKKGRMIKVTKIIVHSTDAINPYLKRYVQPNKFGIGVNKYNNDWNRSGIAKCVGAMIGLLDDGETICTVRTLPYSMRNWGCGKGKNGTYNDCADQFEILEGDTIEYFNKVWKEAVEYSAYLLKYYNLTINALTTHDYVGKIGYGSNHDDPHKYFKKYGKTWTDFKHAVKTQLMSMTDDTFRYEVYGTGDGILNVRDGHNVNSRIVHKLKEGQQVLYRNDTSTNFYDGHSYWWRITKPSIGLMGWVNSRYLRRV